MKKETLKEKMFRIWKANESEDTINIVETKPEDDTVDVIIYPEDDTVNI